MNEIPTGHGIIPARYDSTRFPGKPLTPILGKPMFWHVYQRASQCPDLEQVVLATDDVRIQKAAQDLDVPVIITRSDHHSGTDRVLEAAQKLQLPPRAVVVNIQGDEPALEPVMLSDLMVPFADPTVKVATLAGRLAPEEAHHPNRVKVVLARSGRALYFSRAPIPHPATNSQVSPSYHLHIGLYAFRMETLERFAALPPGHLEGVEKLEQLRLLENDIPIQVVVTDHRSIGVDRPEDVDKVIKLLVE